MSQFPHQLPDLPNFPEFSLLHQKFPRPVTLNLVKTDQLPARLLDITGICVWLVKLYSGVPPATSLLPQSTLQDVEEWLEDQGIPVHIEQASSLEDLALYIESGCCALLLLQELNQLYLANCALSIYGIYTLAVAWGLVREGMEELLQVYVLGSATSTLLHSSSLKEFWLASGGWMIVIDISLPVDQKLSAPDAENL
jgi:hypothetical protein